VIYGHNKKVVFGNLPYLSLGQKIYLKTTSGQIYTYEAYKKDFVNSNKIELVSPTDYEELTVYTCWGLFDLQRVVIKAKPLY
jgi:sortase (surface protein transpeptidase)